MRKLAGLVRGHRNLIALFVLMVLLPAVVFSVLIVRAFRGERARSEYDKQQRQRQIVRLIAAVEMASQRRAYTLWGIVPFVRLQAQRQLGMEPLVAGDPLFQRVMVSIVVNPARFPRANVEAALALERFLLDPKTQARMRQFRHHGLAGQTWWPAGRNNAGAELMQF